MNILFVYPKPNLVFDTAHNLPLGMGYIAAVLEKEGHKVSVIDLNVQEDNLESRLDAVDIVGIYAKTCHIKSAWRLCERIKKYNPRIYVLLGGPHPSVLPDESLQRGDVDFIIRREGEYTFKELCEVLGNGKSFSAVKGLSYRENGNVINNPDRELIKNLDELPFPAYHLFPFHSYTPTRPTWLDTKSLTVGTISTSRGCPFKCVFCFQGIFGQTYRHRDPRRVVDEIKFLIDNYSVNFIEIIDDNFSLLHKRAVEFCKILIEEDLGIQWSLPNGFTRVDNISRELLKLAKKSGCVDFWFAMESGSQRVLDEIINKKTTLEQIRNTVKIAKDEGFEVGAFTCIGNFGETEEEIYKSIDLAIELDLDKCQFTLVTPYPGSRLYQMLSKENKLLIKNWDHYSPYENRAFFEYDGMPKKKIEQLYKTAFRRFYLRSPYIWKTMKRRTTYTNLPLLVKQVWHFMF